MNIGLFLATLPMLILAACSSGPQRQLAQHMDMDMDMEMLGTQAQDDRHVYLSLIRRMQGEGAYYASLAHIDAYRMRHGVSTELRLLQADALRETGQHDAAATLYRELTATSHAAPAWHGLGLIAVARGNTAEAEQALLKASNAAPLNADYLGDLGFLLLSHGDLAKSRAPLAKASELAPTSPKALANLALWASLSGELATAEAIMDRAKLADGSRQEVRRLSLELEPRVRAWRRQSASVTASNGVTGKATAPSTAAPASLAPVTPPQGMLQRFRPDSPSRQSPP